MGGKGERLTTSLVGGGETGIGRGFGIGGKSSLPPVAMWPSSSLGVWLACQAYCDRVVGCPVVATLIVGSIAKTARLSMVEAPFIIAAGTDDNLGSCGATAPYNGTRLGTAAYGALARKAGKLAGGTSGGRLAGVGCPAGALAAGKLAGATRGGRLEGVVWTIGGTVTGVGTAKGGAEPSPGRELGPTVWTGTDVQEPAPAGKVVGGGAEDGTAGAEGGASAEYCAGEG